MKHIQKESHSLTCIPCRGAVSEGSLVHSHEFGTFIRRKSPLGSSKINHWSENLDRFQKRGREATVLLRNILKTKDQHSGMK